MWTTTEKQFHTMNIVFSFLLKLILSAFCICDAQSLTSTNLLKQSGSLKSSEQNSDPVIYPDRLGNTTIYAGWVEGGNYAENIVEDTDGTYGVNLRGAAWRFTINYTYESCCPILHLYNQRSHIQDNGCFDPIYTDVEFFYNNMLVDLAPDNINRIRDDVDCHYKEDDASSSTPMVYCQGERYFLYSIPILWNISFGYICNSNASLNLSYDIHFTELVESEEPPKTINKQLLKKCANILDYEKYEVPNIIGLVDNKQITEIAQVLFGQDFVSSFTTCYKYSVDLICRFLFPNVKERIYYPCVRMCREFIVGCSEDLEINKLDMTCSWLVNSNDSELCFYKPVTCPPPVVQNGATSAAFNTSIAGDTLQLVCDDGYELLDIVGSRPTNGTIRCQFSGNWQPMLTCKPRNSTLTIVLSIVLSICIGFIIIITVLVVYYKRKHAGMTEITPPDVLVLDFYQAKDCRYDIYLCYGEADREYVLKGEECLLKKLEDLGYLLCIHEREFPPGEFVTENIIGAVQQSKCTLLLVSKDFTTREWCMTEFRLCRDNKIMYPQFNMLVAFLEDEKELFEQLPDDHLVKRYAQKFTYLKAYEKNFFKRLLDALPKPTCAESTGVTPGHVGNFVKPQF